MATAMKGGGTLALLSLLLAGCVSGIPEDALVLSPESLQLRQLQTRRFDTGDELRLLTAAAGLLQDMGYTIEESEAKLGVIVGSKDRDATNAGQVVGSVIAALFGAYTPIDKNQRIRVSVVTRPAPSAANATLLRVTFQRTVWNTANQVSRQESLEDPELYSGFFSKLSEAVFLEANGI